MANHRNKVCFHCVFGVVLLIFILNAVLLVSRYGLTEHGKACEEEIADNKSRSTNTSKVGHHYILTSIIIGINNILQFLEYVMLGKCFYSFLFKQNVVKMEPPVSLFKHCNFYPLLLCLIIPYFLLGLAIPALGIYKEIKYSQQVANCYRHYYEVYIVYCTVDFLQYICAFTVRMLMMLSTLVIKEFWQIPKEPSQEYMLANNINEENFFEDWKYVSDDYEKRVDKYQYIGKKVNEIKKQFQAWFIIPWIIYLIASSLKTYNILRPWKVNGDNDDDEPLVNIPDITFYLYNVNQFIALFIPYFCAQIMNGCHNKYYNQMRDFQLNRFKNNPSCFSIARQLFIEKGHFDFLPQIPGTNITVNIGSPLYVILLLSGLFLSVINLSFRGK